MGVLIRQGRVGTVTSPLPGNPGRHDGRWEEHPWTRRAPLFGRHPQYPRPWTTDPECP